MAERKKSNLEETIAPWIKWRGLGLENYNILFIQKGEPVG
jgi:hypothetical protein